MSQNIEGDYDELFKRLTVHDLEIFNVYNTGNYEREKLVLIADKNISEPAFSQVGGFISMCLIFR